MLPEFVVFLLGSRPVDCSREVDQLLRAHRPALLRDYRVPEVGDVKGTWATFVKGRHACPYFVGSDLNDDGVSDYAIVLPGRRGGYGVFALLSTGQGYVVQTLERSTKGPWWSVAVYECPAVPDVNAPPTVKNRSGHLCVGLESPRSYYYDQATSELRRALPLRID